MAALKKRAAQVTKLCCTMGIRELGAPNGFTGFYVALNFHLKSSFLRFEFLLAGKNSDYLYC